MTEMTEEPQHEGSGGCILPDLLLKFHMQKNPLDSFSKTWIPRLTSEIESKGWMGLWWICMSDKLPGDGDAAGPWTTLGGALPKTAPLGREYHARQGTCVTQESLYVTHFVLYPHFYSFFIQGN